MPSYKEIYNTGTYLKCEDLKGKKVPVMIERAVLEDVGKENDKKKMIVLHFSKVGGDVFDKDKTFPLNVTNAGQIAEHASTDDYEKWFNLKIKLIPARTDFRGQQVDCIRVEPPEPEEIPEEDVPF